jgi:hypothetical protein
VVQAAPRRYSRMCPPSRSRRSILPALARPWMQRLDRDSDDRICSRIEFLHPTPDVDGRDRKTPSRVRFRPPPPGTFRISPCGIQRTALRNGFNLVASRTRCDGNATRAELTDQEVGPRKFAKSAAFVLVWGTKIRSRAIQRGPPREAFHLERPSGLDLTDAQTCALTLAQSHSLTDLS